MPGHRANLSCAFLSAQSGTEVIRSKRGARGFVGYGWAYLFTCTLTFAGTLHHRQEADINEAHLKGRTSLSTRALSLCRFCVTSPVKEPLLKPKRTASTLATGAAFVIASASFNAYAQSEASALSAISAMPVASVVAGASVTAGAVLAVPAILSTAGATLVIKAVEVSARSTVYVLERASDGARVSLEVLGRGVTGASVVAGTVATVSVIAAGVVLSAAGEVIAFIPNAVGRALLYNERVTQ